MLYDMLWGGGWLIDMRSIALDPTFSHTVAAITRTDARNYV